MEARLPFSSSDPYASFIAEGVVPRYASHASGTLDRANAILSSHPEVANRDVHTCAILGDADGVKSWLERDAANATTKGGTYDWDALTHLCFSRYLRLDPTRSDGFVQAATALLKAGANANTGFFEGDHQPEPEWESALYGAAGVAHHEGVTRLLMQHGANPNDNEVPYHAPEGWDNAALRVILESAKLTPDSLTMMLLRKSDWHDLEGMRLVVAHGADVNRKGLWGKTMLHHALRSDNRIGIIEFLMSSGADPRIESDGVDAVAKAAQSGRGDVLALFRRLGVEVELSPMDSLLAACASGDAAAVAALRVQHPDALSAIVAKGGELLAAFARTGNREGVEQLLTLGIGVDTPFMAGEGYFDIAPNSTALHVAAWRAWPAVLRLLIERGADVNRRDGRGRTPLQLAVRATVDSYWAERRTPESVQTLLERGANVAGVRYPSGYDEVDTLLQRWGAA